MRVRHFHYVFSANWYHTSIFYFPIYIDIDDIKSKPMCFIFHSFNIVTVVFYTPIFIYITYQKHTSVSIQQ